MKDWRDHIEMNPKKMFGKPVIKNTRVPVDLILEKLSKGESIESLLKGYPNLTMDTILAVFAYAADSVRNEVVYKIAS